MTILKQWAWHSVVVGNSGLSKWTVHLISQWDPRLNAADWP